jgi:dihydropyrimidine dehydrogenase (NAD+) subunit PreT
LQQGLKAIDRGERRGEAMVTETGEISDIRAGRLPAEAYQENFGDLHPPLTRHHALIESNRCLFCFDAPCVTACPTSIDIPRFIRKISTDNLKGAAQDILGQNIMGAMCARVCPTETLCEEACVRNLREHKPVLIGLLQRYAVDHVLDAGIQLFRRGPETGKHVAVVGGGPAGLACAHRLSMLGHQVTLFEARDKLGGLNEYGIAAYKVVDQIAQREVAYILAIGGIAVRLGAVLGRDVTLSGLRRDHDAVFLGLGLGGANALGLEQESVAGVYDAVDYIAQLRQAEDLSLCPVGRRIVVIGGGMTAIDIAVQTKKLGAEDVTIVYRRGKPDMKASGLEQDLAQTTGVKIKHWAAPKRLLVDHGAVRGVEFEYTRLDEGGRLAGTGDTFRLGADMVFKAIGQLFVPLAGNGGAEVLELRDGRISVNDDRQTSLADVWAGGDCVSGGDDLTVAAVADGRIAAESIDRSLRQRP